MAQHKLNSLKQGGHGGGRYGCGGCRGGGVSAPPQGYGVNLASAAPISVLPAGIERNSTVLGCTYDADEVQTGTVIIQHTVNEDGTAGGDDVQWWAVGATAPIAYAAGTHGAWKACAGEAATPAVRTRCMCDDVNGDGSDIVKYVEAYQVEVSPTGALSSTPLGIYTDDSLTTAYTPVNGSDCGAVGNAHVTRQGQRELTTGLWSPGPLVKDYTIRVDALNDPAVLPTFTDSFGNARTLALGEIISFAVEDGFVDTSVTLSVSTGDRVIITYNELGV